MDNSLLAVRDINHKYIVVDEDLTFIRLLLGGECDYGMRYKWIKKQAATLDVKIQELLEENKISKTSWVSDWLQFYLCYRAGLKKSGLDERGEFFREMENEDKRECVKSNFEKDFPELGELMNMVCWTVPG